MIKTIVIDDEEINNRLLISLLKEYCPAVEVVASANSVHDGLAAIMKHKPNLLYLDIEIHDRSGFDILHIIENPEVYVVVVSAYEKYALQAIKHNAHDYILKPIQIDELIRSVNKYISYYTKSTVKEPEPTTPPKMLNVASKDQVEFINTREIIYLEAKNTSTIIFTADKKKYVASKPIKDIMEQLPAQGFLRVHKSYAVNLEQIDKYLRSRNGSLMMKNGIEIPIAESKKMEVIKILKL